jgi:hypothetical protein
MRGPVAATAAKNNRLPVAGRLQRGQVMELRLDVETFDKYQEAFIGEVIKSIRVKLQEAGLEGERLENLTAHIAFSVASLIDDTSNIEVDGADVKPYLAFRTGEDELLHCGENAATYEFVPLVLKAMFEG